MLKFPVDGGIVTIRSTILIPTECATVTTSSKDILKEVEVRHENFKVALHPNFPDQEVAIEGTLSAKGRMKLCSILKENLDIFAWKPSDMTGVPRSVAEHRLNIWEGYSPVRQKKSGQALERAKAIQAEVQKLVEAGIMREVYYHDRLSNPVMVKKHDVSWRMNVDFTDLNKACPHDCYPLPKIDWKVESLCGYPFKCFLDTYKGYHQIQMAESDEEKTAFHTSQGVYCYTKMPFGLKNVGATYQLLVDKDFDSHVGRNIEVYVDDLVIKSYTKAEMLRDIDETFLTLRRINMKLNPKNCMFGVVKGMFLGYMISPKGIKPCPDKTEAVLQLPSPKTIKEKCIKKSDFHWTPKVEQAFKQLKQHLSELPLLVAPKPKEKLIVYLFASHGAINGSGAGLILTSPEGMEFTYALRFQFTASNNEGPEKVKFLIVAMDYFTQWIEAKAVAKITGNQVKKFAWDNIVCRFGFPGEIISDNANRSLGKGFKARLGEGNKNWIEEILHVLWAYRTMIKSNHGDTPFSLTYGTKAVIPAKIRMPTYRTTVVDAVHNDEELRLNLDLLEEWREHAAICEAKAKLKMTKYYNAKVRGVTFKPGDFVYHSNEASHAMDGGKLGPK
ncbi:reverse transcriptase domain-containing protein [Tanacetum coccineum]